MNVSKAQEQYYMRTAGQYDAMHVQVGDEHSVALKYISALVPMVGATSILDVGCGTGRGLKYFAETQPHLRVMGVEPVEAMISEAITRNGVHPEQIFRGSGDHLPFEDRSFDIVCEFAVLHHASEPNAVVEEMIRVARKAVFLSDSNRFGRGRMLARLLKLSLSALHLWKLANLINTGGKGYSRSDGDGIFYSYSVYDSLKTLSAWADRVILIPTGNEPVRDWLHPLLTSQHILVCALKENIEQ